MITDKAGEGQIVHHRLPKMLAGDDMVNFMVDHHIRHMK